MKTLWLSYDLKPTAEDGVLIDPKGRFWVRAATPVPEGWCQSGIDAINRAERFIGVSQCGLIN